MSDMQILSGTGAQHYAGVTENNRLMTAGIALSLTEAATESGDTYNIKTSTINLTTASTESALLYIKNKNTTRNLIIDLLISNIKDYAGTDGQPTLTVHRNPTAGTLISNAVPGTQGNRNYKSENTLEADIFEGVDGDTITAQDSAIDIFLSDTSISTFNAFPSLVLLGPGSSVGLSYKTPSGMTSVDLVLAVTATLNGTQL